jgi:hypothetical protein
VTCLPVGGWGRGGLRKIGARPTDRLSAARLLASKRRLVGASGLFYAAEVVMDEADLRVVMRDNTRP